MALISTHNDSVLLPIFDKTCHTKFLVPMRIVQVTELLLKGWDMQQLLVIQVQVLHSWSCAEKNHFIHVLKLVRHLQLLMLLLVL